MYRARLPSSSHATIGTFSLGWRAHRIRSPCGRAEITRFFLLSPISARLIVFLATTVRVLSRPTNNLMPLRAREYPYL